MAKNERYIKNIELGLPAETVEPRIQEFIKENDFYSSQWHGNVCWMSDYMNVTGYHFFDYSYDGYTLHIEAWLRNGKEGEMGLTGFTAATAKAPYLRKINQLTEQLTQLIPADSPLKAQALEQLGAEEKLVRKNRTVAYVALIAVACFMLLYTLIAPSRNIFTFLSAFIVIVALAGMFQNLRK